MKTKTISIDEYEVTFDYELEFFNDLGELGVEHIGPFYIITSVKIDGDEVSENEYNEDYFEEYIMKNINN